MQSAGAPVTELSRIKYRSPTQLPAMWSPGPPHCQPLLSNVYSVHNPGRQLLPDLTGEASLTKAQCKQDNPPAANETSSAAGPPHPAEWPAIISCADHTSPGHILPSPRIKDTRPGSLQGSYCPGQGSGNGRCPGSARHVTSDKLTPSSSVTPSESLGPCTWSLATFPITMCLKDTTEHPGPPRVLCKVYCRRVCGACSLSKEARKFQRAVSSQWKQTRIRVSIKTARS